ncbi:hypothetical protein C8J56DRAFT_1048098 [Mycena floridula]|nr:hypothetical protein C8J56DRAFT_1048098 [Mycena floridula]
MNIHDNSSTKVPLGLLFVPVSQLESLELNLATFDQMPSNEKYSRSQTLDGPVDCEAELEMVSLGSTRRFKDTSRTVEQSSSVTFNVTEPTMLSQGIEQMEIVQSQTQQHRRAVHRNRSTNNSKTQLLPRSGATLSPMWLQQRSARDY